MIFQSFGTRLVQDPVFVAGDDVFYSQVHEHFDDGGTGGTGTVEDDMDVFHLLVHDLKGIDQCG